ncbi:MAG: acetate--CoA ligase family protein [Pseudomonadota bacterium]
MSMPASPNNSALARLLSPKSIVFIGGAEAEVALQGTLSLGFPGKIYAVHPKRDALADIPTVPTLDDLPEKPEAAFIAIRREPSIEAVRTLAAMGTAGAVVYASGFGEVGGEGPQLQAELIEAAGDMAIIGPNCYGFVSYLDRLAAWPDIYGGGPVESGVAIITQSGSIAGIMANLGRTLPYAGIYTLGNQAQVGMAELLSHLCEDERITAIGLHIEGLSDVVGFAESARKARNLQKPVIALKTGRSEAGARTTRSHTNSLSGADDLYDALFERFGIARLASLSAFLETLTLLHYGGPIPGHRIVTMSCSGGEAALAADLIEPMRLETPPFPEHSKQMMASVLNDYVQLENPLDYHTFIWGLREELTTCYAGGMSGGFDYAFLMMDCPASEDLDDSLWQPSIDAIIDAKKQTGARAALTVHYHESMSRVSELRLNAAGIPILRGLQDALDAVEAAGDIGANWALNEEPPSLITSAPVDANVVQLTEFEGKQFASSYGLQVPAGEVCSPCEADSAAARIGFPVTVKISSSELAHKTEAGGLALNLSSEAEVADAVKKMTPLGDQVLVEEMVQGAVCELIIGLKRDPQFGLALVIGAGGILTELLSDSATLILPTSRAEIERALGRLKIARLIDGYRGKSGDREAVIAAIEAVARLAAYNADTIEELDINPLLVLAPGQGAVAVDALIRIRQG